MVQQQELAFLILRGVESSQNVSVRIFFLSSQFFNLYYLAAVT